MTADSRPASHPFDQFVLKVHSRCNLACDYCYVYTMVDQSWADQPVRMTRATVDATAGRIAEHVRTHRIPKINIALHGGEPLLAGLDEIAYCVEAIRAAVGHLALVQVTVQTNGVGLDQVALDRLRQLGVRIGVSLDGNATAHDRHRRQRNGTGTHVAVAAALRKLSRPENASSYAGLLCTIDLANDPVTTYEALVAHRPPQIDFLLPHGNWSVPPPARTASSPSTPYADWLVRVFDRWFDHPLRETGIRTFDDIIALLLGGAPTVAGTGLLPITSIVVQTDGRIEVCDALTATYPGAAVTGLTVADHPFDDVMQNPLVRQRQSGLAALGPICRTCSIVEICGGGSHSQRYRAGSGFQNPSVYCPDLFALIVHIRGRVEDGVESMRSLLDGTTTSPHRLTRR